MKKILDSLKKGFKSYYVVMLVLAASSLISGCDKERLDVQEVFPFEVKVMPVPKEILNGEIVEIRFSIISNGDYTGNSFFIRYFQNDGEGSLRYQNLKPYLPNDLYPLGNKEFRLYYTSRSIVSQNFDVWIADSFGNEKQLTFQFNHKNGPPVIETTRDN